MPAHMRTASETSLPDDSPFKLPDSPNKLRNPYLGRGGFLGPSFVITGMQFGPLLEAVRVYTITSLWLLIVVQFFIGLVLLTPLKLLGGPGNRLYVYLTMLWDGFSQGAILCVPFSWCGLCAYTNTWPHCLESKAAGSSLYMSNHSSRVDWLIGLYLGYITGPRVHVRFIAEITMAFMPIAGWSRFLIGDILLRRTFHRDAINVRKKLAEYESVPNARMVFFAPEGAIADVGNEKDSKYIDACEAFMTELGRPKLQFLLTPRYKGLSVLKAHAPDNICTATMAFVTSQAPFGRDIQFAPDGKIEGGSLCTLPQRDPERVVPDLHTVFGGGLHVFVKTERVSLPEENLATPTAGSDAAAAPPPNHKLRDALLDDYARKDAELLEFKTRRKFKGVTKADDWVQFPCPHLSMNLTVVAYAFIGLNWVSYVYGINSYVGAFRHMATVWFVFVLLHALSHVIGVAVSGHSRESLVGESAFKAILELAKGGLDHGDKAAGKAKAKAKKAE